MFFAIFLVYVSVFSFICCYKPKVTKVVSKHTPSLECKTKKTAEDKTVVRKEKQMEENESCISNNENQEEMEEVQLNIPYESEGQETSDEQQDKNHQLIGFIQSQFSSLLKKKRIAYRLDFVPSLREDISQKEAINATNWQLVAREIVIKGISCDLIFHAENEYIFVETKFSMKTTPLRDQVATRFGKLFEYFLNKGITTRYVWYDRRNSQFIDVDGRVLKPPSRENLSDLQNQDVEYTT